MSSTGETYKPSEHGGLKKDGTPDARVSPNNGFGGNRELAREAGKQGGHTQPDEIYKPTEAGGTKKDGTEDKRTRPDHGFGGDRQAAAEAGKKGGLSS